MKENKDIITENKVIIENGKIKFQLTEEAQRKGHVFAEEAKKLAFQYYLKIKELQHKY